MQKVQPSRAFSGERLRKLRKEAGLKGSDIHRATGIDQRTISAWVCGRRLPNSQSLALLADAIGCRIDDFFTEANDVA
ncbi:helix-turn-helix domain-containing protein [Streptomyces ortus]|uniref:Helix-turn-helix domain-containing protein n=1 Tax=Streptomyces ortus TaxID=2867268 RepID=A0ABT3UZ01_9ACTN|nr:helix-turn-helix transcriptional regulator [Streptomyces ortus]MCX4232823.1 helix-turn-helix domain-containing protein [Streptomyces ortus]